MMEVICGEGMGKASWLLAYQKLLLLVRVVVIWLLGRCSDLLRTVKMLTASHIFVGFVGLRDLKTRLSLVALGEERIVVEHLRAQIGPLRQGFLD